MKRCSSRRNAAIRRTRPAPPSIGIFLDTRHASSRPRAESLHLTQPTTPLHAHATSPQLPHHPTTTCQGWSTRPGEALSRSSASLNARSPSTAQATAVGSPSLPPEETSAPQVSTWILPTLLFGEQQSIFLSYASVLISLVHPSYGGAAVLRSSPTTRAAVSWVAFNDEERL